MVYTPVQVYIQLTSLPQRVSVSQVCIVYCWTVSILLLLYSRSLTQPPGPRAKVKCAHQFTTRTPTAVRATIDWSTGYHPVLMAVLIFSGKDTDWTTTCFTSNLCLFLTNPSPNTTTLPRA